MLQLRIFLSSPGDMAPERAAAREVVDQLMRGPVWQGKLHIDLIAWDDPYAGIPMQAGETAQLSVNRYAGLPRDCDLTVVLLWSRIGTPLPAGETRSDGTPFESGTVWEFEDAMGAKRPVWLYRCKRAPLVSLRDPELAKKHQQSAAVDRFFAQFTQADGSNTGGINDFESTDDFADLFGRHLNAELRLRDEAARAAARPAGAAPPAPAGPPALQAWDFSAYLASKRAHFVGRGWLFDEIQAWINGAAPRALLIRADFGVGKSALMAEFIHRDQQREAADRQVVGWHFCQHDTRETLRASVLVRSLAAQLAAKLPRYSAVLAEQPALLQQLERAAEDPGSAFEAAVLNPLLSLTSPASARVVVVDALDESLEVGEARAGIVALLASKVGRLPGWLRLLVTSRNNPAVTGRLKGAFGMKEIDAEAGLNLDDIANYARQRCNRAPLDALLRGAAMDPEVAALALRDKSGGKFLYAVRVLDDLANGLIAPEQMLQLPPGMDGFYLDSFERRFGPGPQDWTLAHALLAVMAAAREPLTPAQLAQVIGAPAPGAEPVSEAGLKALRAEAFSDFIRQRGEVWSFDHFSLLEWLTRDDADGNPRAGPYALDLTPAHTRLADWGLAQFRSTWPDCAEHVLRHLVPYLLAAGRAADANTLLLNLAWLQTKLTCLRAPALLADFEAAGAARREVALVGQTLAMCAHILGREPTQLPAQLLGRLPHGEGAALDALLDACAKVSGLPRLQPLVPSLQPPGHALRVLEGHSDVVYMADYSPDGEFILSASADATVRLWRRNGELTAELVGHSGAINHVSTSPDTQWIASAGEDQTVRLWRRTGEAAGCFNFDGPVLGVEFDRAGQHLLVALRQRRAFLIDLEGRILARLEGHERALTSAHFGLIGGNPHIVTASGDGTARLWSDKGEPLAKCTGHTQGLTGAWILPEQGGDGACILTTSLDATARLWRRDGSLAATCVGHGAVLNHATCSADGARLLTASNDNTARLWRRDGTPLAVLRGHQGWVTRALFSPDSRLIATAACDNDLRLWSSADGSPRGVLRGHANWVLHLVFSADGRQVLSAARDNSARLWRVDALELPARHAHNAEVTDLAVSRDGQQVLSAGNDQAIRLWSPNGQPWTPAPTIPPTHDDWVTQVVCSPVDDTWASAACDGSLGRWSRDGTRLEQRAAHAASINCLRYAPDGRTLASASNDATACLWQVGAPTDAAPVRLQGHDDAVNDVDFSADGRHVVTASNDKTARVWAASGALVAVLEGHTGWVLAARFAPDGSGVITASADGSVRRWALDGQPLGMLCEQGQPVERLAVDAVRGSVALGRHDGVVLLSHDGRAPALPVWQHPGPVTALTLARTGGNDTQRLASGSADGELRLARCTEAGVQDLACLDLDTPVAALALHGERLFAGDALGQVHFLEHLVS